MSFKRQIPYRLLMANTFHDMVYNKHTDHEKCAHTNGKGLRQEFTESGFGWAMKCLSIRDGYLKKELANV